MNCDEAGHLIDEYLENRLGQYERQRLEMHLTFCAGCAEELRHRPAFERSMWRALSSSVQHLYLPPEASSRIVREAQSSLGRAIWSGRIAVGSRVLAAVAALALVVMGALLLAGQISVPLEFQPAAEFQASEPSLSVTNRDIYVEPWELNPGEPFTMTVLLRSDLAEPLGTVRFNLDIEGPTGEYSFAMAARGPLPARGVSVIEVTPELLEAPCQEQYQISAADIMSTPGVYTLRATLFIPVAAASR